MYVNNTAFRSIGGEAQPIVLSASFDGGSTWRQPQLTSAVSNAQSGGRQGCAVRTDSTGVVYVVWEGTRGGHSVVYLARSFDGGSNFDKPRPIASVFDVGVFDCVSGRCVFDGLADRRTDSFPSLSIANGAPTGAGASNTLVLTWARCPRRLNNEQALVQTSTDQGQTWSSPINAAEAGDRPDNPAIAIPPTGTDVYVVYNAFCAAVRDDHRQPPTEHSRRGPPRLRRRGRDAVGVVDAAPRRGRRRARHHHNPEPQSCLTTTSRPRLAVTARSRRWTWATPASCPAVNAYRQPLIDGNPIAPP